MGVAEHLADLPCRRPRRRGREPSAMPLRQTGRGRRAAATAPWPPDAGPHARWGAVPGAAASRAPLDCRALAGLARA